MPRARANIIAKFIAQIETGTTWLISTSEPAEATRPGQGQQQRQPGRDEGAEGQHQDGQRHRPGEHLRLQHRVEVGLVEVRPQQRGAGRVDLDAVGGQGLQRALEVVGHAHHLVGVRAGAGQEDGGGAVLAQRRAGLRLDDVGDARLVLRSIAVARASTCSARTRGDRAVGGVHDDLDRRAGVAAEVLLGQLAGGRPTPSRRPASRRRRAAASTLGANDPEPDDDQQPHHGGEAGVVGHPHAQPAQRAGPVAEVGVGVGRGGPGRWRARRRRPSTSWRGSLSVRGRGIGGRGWGVRAGRAAPGRRCRPRRRGPGR